MELKIECIPTGEIIRVVNHDGDTVCPNCKAVELMMAEAQASFTSLELRVIMKFLFLQGKSAKDIHTEMSQTLVEKCPSYSTVKTWVSFFKTGHFTIEGDHRSVRPTSLTDPATSDAVHKLIIECPLQTLSGEQKLHDDL